MNVKPLFSEGGQIDAEIQRQAELINQSPFIAQLLEAFPECAAIINADRQIVLANAALTHVIAKQDGYRIEGARIGDHMQCINALDSPDGCGTHEACTTCGARIAQQAALDGRSAIEECYLTINVDNELFARDFRVYTSPLEIGGERFSVVSLVDISNEKRRRILEQIFFHDVNNTAGSIYGISKLFPLMESDAERADLMHRIARASHQLLDEIETQRDLLSAENGELEVFLQETPVKDILETVQTLYSNHPAAEKRHIAIENAHPNAVVVTDVMQITRTLGNLVKNALEAVGEGETVTLGFARESPAEVRFTVHNPGVIPPEVALQIFHRSFSTKGAGRGIGTYSVKLLVEHYLHGKAAFDTSPENGTTFSILVPDAGVGKDD